MNAFVDREYVGYGKLHFDVPVCSWLDEHRLVQQGYWKVMLPHIRIIGDGERSQVKIEISNWREVVAHNLDEFLPVSFRSLPVLIYAVWSFDGGEMLCPYRIQIGTQFPTRLRDSLNAPVLVDVIEEPRIVLY